MKTLNAKNAENEKLLGLIVHGAVVYFVPNAFARKPSPTHDLDPGRSTRPRLPPLSLAEAGLDRCSGSGMTEAAPVKRRPTSCPRPCPSSLTTCASVLNAYARRLARRNASIKRPGSRPRSSAKPVSGLAQRALDKPSRAHAPDHARRASRPSPAPSTKRSRLAPAVERPASRPRPRASSLTAFASALDQAVQGSRPRPGRSGFMPSTMRVEPHGLRQRPRPNVQGSRGEQLLSQVN
jgi:hypothetical protein